MGGWLGGEEVHKQQRRVEKQRGKMRFGVLVQTLLNSGPCFSNSFSRSASSTVHSILYLIRVGVREVEGKFKRVSEVKGE